MSEGIFSGLVFAFNSHSTFTPSDSELSKLIIDNGGDIDRNVSKKVTHLICPFDNNSTRIDNARRHDIPLVTESFITDSVKVGIKLEEESYVIPPAENFTSNKQTKKVNSVALMTQDEDMIPESKQPTFANRGNAPSFSISLRLDYLDPKRTVDLEAGSTILGRGDLLQIDDKKVSRNQAEIVVDQELEKATLIVHGLNPCMVYREDSEPKVLQRGNKTVLNDKNTFNLLVTDYPITVLIRSAEDVASKPNPIKRKTEDESDYQPKKAKLQDAPVPDEDDDRPICPFGSNCYRKNPQHRLEMRHIDSNTDNAPKSKSKPNKKSSEGLLSLAFPSISTSTFQFDVNKAAQVACDVITDFLKRHANPDLRLYLVDMSFSDTLRTFKKYYHGDDRFQIVAADITDLKSAGIPSCYIANATNENFYPKGSGVNKAINEAAGPSLNARLHKAAEPGGVYPVELDEESPLRTKQGVHYVIHVLGPNMNPTRSNCLHGDYKTGCKQLQQCYKDLFETFAQLAGYTIVASLLTVVRIVSEPAENNNNNNNDDKFNQLLQDIDEDIKENTQKKPTGNNVFSVLMAHSGNAFKEPQKESKPKQNFSASILSLVPYVTHPEKHADAVYLNDGEVVVVYDKYPKAKHHLLMIPNPMINNFAALTAEHIPLLKAMKQKAKTIVSKIADENTPFRIGFHAAPSMSPIHMHIISEDFDSEHLKNKKHWNSFTTRFFVDIDRFMDKLKKHGQIKFDKAKYENLLKVPLKCHRCHEQQPTIPALKSHIAGCSE